VIGDTQPIILIVEVLPAPFGPRKPNDSPVATSKSMPSTATKSPNSLRRPRALITDDTLAPYGSRSGTANAVTVPPVPAESDISNQSVIRPIEPVDLDWIVEINAANVPEVGAVDADRMAYLLGESPIALRSNSTDSSSASAW
jgi:hypothetical protein